MNATAYYHQLGELLKDIQSHIQKEKQHAIILVNDYLNLQTLFTEQDVDIIKKAIEQKIATSADWPLVKKNFIPTLPAEQQKLLEPLLSR